MGIREHLASRGMDPDRPGIMLDEANDIATFLLWNLSGQLVGYQQYNPAGTKDIRNDARHRDRLRYYTFSGDEGDPRRDGRKRLVAWGLDTLFPGQRVVFLAEGVFDAVKLHNLGLPALAVIANDPKHLRPFLRALGRTVIAVCDNDAAGSRLGACADMSLKVPEPHHDLGDMPQEEVRAWLTTASILQ